ncbi:MAG: alginate export family protein [Candidatus Ratteibacteria bacterium]|nr:alginate export family protein [Candidatus Ratteibacteria bacterium]
MKRMVVCLALILFTFLSNKADAMEMDYSYGGDLRFRAFYREVDLSFDGNDKKTRGIYQLRGRLFSTLNLFEEMLEVHGQIRKPYFFGDNYADYLNNSRVEIDLAYLKLNHIFDWPVEITLGKQELLYGEGFLTGDRDVFRDFIEDDPENFTAIKARYLRDQLTVDAFYSRVYDSHGEPGNVGDNDFAGLVALYEFSPENTIEPYLFLDDDSSRKLHNHPNSDRVWILGCRATGEISENFYLKAEGCYQWGDFNTASFSHLGLAERDYKAWGGYVGGEYHIPSEYSPSLALTLINLSGEEYPDSGDYNAFHPLFRSERFGELHTKYTEENRMIVRSAFKCQPADKVDFLLEWFHYRANEKPLDRNGKHDGDEIDLRLNYEYNERLSFGLFAGWFIPGDYWPGTTITRACGEDVKTQVMGEVTFKF